MPKPSDIRDVILTSQEVIDKAVATVAETTKTQEIFGLNIQYTEKKIGVHNEDPESHEDIRVRLQDMPSMITDPVITGPSAVESGEEATWTFSATSIMPTVALESFVVIDDKGNQHTVPADENGTGQWSHIFEGTRNQPTSFSVRAQASHKFSSAVVSFPLTITVHLPPSLEGATFNFPTRVSHGKTYDFSISGITDPDDDLSGISIAAPDGKVTFSSSSALIQGQNYQLTLANDYVGPGKLTLIITAKDERDLQTTHSVQIPVNCDPDITGFTHNIPYHLNKNSSNTVRVSGVIDPDGDEVTFDVSATPANIALSKTQGIHLNEDFLITVDNLIAQNTAYTLTFTFKDAIGGQTVATVSSTINTPPSVTGFTCTQDPFHVPGKTSTISFAGATDSNNEDIVYEIVNGNQDLIFNKTVNIAANEAVNVTFKSSAAHGEDYQITVYAVDTSGGKTPIVVNMRTNSLISQEDLTLNIPEIGVPGQTYECSINTAKDADDQVLTYSIVSDNANAEITDGTDIAAFDTFTVKMPTVEQLARGAKVTLTITVNDGLETVTYTTQIEQNKIPNVTDFKVTDTPTSITGGTENKFEMGFSGLLNPYATDVTFNLVDIDPLIHFTKTAELASDEKVEVYFTKVAEATDVSFTVNIVDAQGEVTPKTFTLTIDPIIVTAAPKITYPLSLSNPVEVPHYEPWTLTWGEYQEVADVDMDHTVYPWNDSVAWDASFNEPNPVEE